MTTQPKLEPEPQQSNQDHHGPFYRSGELVAAVHRAEGGIFEAFRAAHAFGRIYAGTFTATPAAKELSRAAHFQGTPVPVTARLSGSSGDPKKKPSIVNAMATKFYYTRLGDYGDNYFHRPGHSKASGQVPARVDRDRRGD